VVRPGGADAAADRDPAYRFSATRTAPCRMLAAGRVAGAGVCLVPEGRTALQVKRRLRARIKRVGTSSPGAAWKCASSRFVEQDVFDRVLWACDCNFVRGRGFLRPRSVGGAAAGVADLSAAGGGPLAQVGGLPRPVLRRPSAGRGRRAAGDVGWLEPGERCRRRVGRRSGAAAPSCPPTPKIGRSGCGSTPISLRRWLSFAGIG